MQKKKSTIINILLLLFTIVISLLVVEFLLRSFYIRDGLQHHIEIYSHSCYTKTRPSNISDRYVLTRIGTDVLFETNNLGFRDAQHELVKPDDTYRIVMVGDSMLEGREVEFKERLDQQLQSLLQQKGQNVEVITFAVSSNFPTVYGQLLDCIGYQYNPDMVVVGYFPHNDFRPFANIDTDRYKEIIARTKNTDERTLQGSNENFIGTNIKLFGEKESRLLMFLYDTSQRLKESAETETSQHFIDNGTFMDVYLGVDTSTSSKKYWNNKTDFLAYMSDEAVVHETDLLFVNLGMANAVKSDDGVFKEYGNSYTLEQYKNTIEKERDIFKNLEVGYIDLFPVLQDAHKEGGKSLYADGKHYSPRGHTVVAKELESYIIEKIYEK